MKERKNKRKIVREEGEGGERKREGKREGEMEG